MAKTAPAKKPPFSKAALTPQALLAKLKAQGLIVDDDELPLNICVRWAFPTKGILVPVSRRSDQVFSAEDDLQRNL